jgi:filamentous hemagglutinin
MGGSPSMNDLWWGFWRDYPKVIADGREYAKIGDRLYTEHAVTRFLPSGRRTIANVLVADKEGGGYAFDPKARSISPNFIEHVIRTGFKRFVIEKGELRTIHALGDLQVVTTRDDEIVITCMYSHESA